MFQRESEGAGIGVADLSRARQEGIYRKCEVGPVDGIRPSGFVNWCSPLGEINFCIFMTGGSGVRR